MLNVIYLASGYAKLEYENVIYQDKFIMRDIQGDMLDIDLSGYDVIIASPPCNYYSRANWRRNVSNYSLSTKHLLPDIIKKLKKINKPFIVENVMNKSLMKNIIFENSDIFYYEIGRHCYFSNIMFDFTGIHQIEDNIQNLSSKARQGGYNVNHVFNKFVDLFLEIER
jgi:site-specific DNA-cytosine methylase